MESFCWMMMMIASWILHLVLVLVLVLVLSMALSWLMKPKPAIKTVKNKHVFITGGSMGIGFELAKQALLQEAFVTIVARFGDALRNAVEDLTKLTQCSSDHINFQVADICNYEQISEAVKASHSWRPIDVLVCNAGVAKSEYLDRTSVYDIHRVVQTNLTGTLYTIHAALPLMKKKEKNPNSNFVDKSQSKAIMIVASLASLYVFYGHAVYTATKYAQKGIADALRRELMPHNISVGISCPGFTDTPMLQNIFAEIPSDMLAAMKVLCLCYGIMVEKPRDVALYILNGIKKGSFLASDVPGYLLGILSRGAFPAESFTAFIVELILYLPLRFTSILFAGFTPAIVSRSVRNK